MPGSENRKIFILLNRWKNKIIKFKNKSEVNICIKLHLGKSISDCFLNLFIYLTFHLSKVLFHYLWPSGSSN